MLKQCRDDLAEHEMTLAAGLAEVAAELRLTDAADLVAFIRTRQFGNLRHLVNASTELYFKPGTVSFGEAAEARLGWSGEPSIMLDMQFRHRAVDIFFRLVLEARQAGVEIEYIAFGGRPADARAPAQRLAEALADARFSSSRPSGQRQASQPC